MGLGSHLENGKSGIRVFDRRHSTIGVDRLIGFFLHVWEIQHFVLVLETEFFEDNGSLPRVGALEQSVNKCKGGGSYEQRGSPGHGHRE